MGAENFKTFVNKEVLDAFINGEFVIVHDAIHNDELLTLFELCELTCDPPLPYTVSKTFYRIDGKSSWSAGDTYPKNRVLFIQDLFNQIGYTPNS